MCSSVLRQGRGLLSKPIEAQKHELCRVNCKLKTEKAEHIVGMSCHTLKVRQCHYSVPLVLSSFSITSTILGRLAYHLGWV